MTETNAFGRRELIETTMNRAPDGTHPAAEPADRSERRLA